ncbi:Methylated-DNA--protein-cysteine methyltransferase [Heterocephalus glaber]|uniref:Methylated-DNA--protein-cysteine methyltransferase n=1 Tax=Heterocephalus glaber TaxID=10181 RepID=G5BTI2_HETGA|nr:Methylated-DNA--protein-cysteine methyltransferase [Heterocephalus glaber]
MTEPLMQCIAWLDAYFHKPVAIKGLPLPAFHHPVFQQEVYTNPHRLSPCQQVLFTFCNTSDISSEGKVLRRKIVQYLNTLCKLWVHRNQSSVQDFPGFEKKAHLSIQLVLQELLAGHRRYGPAGNSDSFTRQVLWKLLKVVKFGETISYQQLAALAGNPKAARAVGGAMRNNPVPILIPCHRVICSSGAMGNYSGGQGVKEWLLAHEGNQHCGALNADVETSAA